MNATQEQIEKANNTIANGCKLSFEKVLSMVIKADLKNQPRKMTKKDYEKQAIRNAICTLSMVEIQEKNEENLRMQRNIYKK